ncbi:MAG TPA: tripartite tricarboxylate transporter substrate-binding protein [Alphaproteobacteria bacterium]|nr:tripartite tricarboxylate transporter substrate-binding protein [Alphaproteobacteria bacterium]
MSGRFYAAAAALCAVFALPQTGAAQSVESAFKGKSLNVFIGSGPGGGYDLYGRLVARHMGKHVPGQPNLVAQNKPGAGGFVMSQWLYAAAPKDGLNIGTVPQNAPTEEALGNPAAMFESAKFLWIGRVNSNVPVHYVWHTAQVQSLEDLKTKELLTGADTPTSTQTTNPRILNLIAGTKFNIINGYGTGAKVRLAIEGGEVQAGVAPLSLLMSEMASWLRDKQIKILVQYSPERHPSIPDVPASVELARNDEERKILNFFVADSAIGRAVAAPPGVAADRIKALRDAFDAMIKDPEFIADTSKRNIEVDAMSGEKLQTLVANMMDLPADTLDKARAAAKAAMSEGAR